ncbi:MAG TPA: alpha/beta hydrolase [Hellea balneolensis]|uniref:Alpha/beta hydrolase n=1 Tax=Hellea balneolensis TaxID=287478 RepID=A0A7V5NXG5_9PROT|nr:alpha/beta hydrolase [Hellea balneolensis]
MRYILPLAIPALGLAAGYRWMSGPGLGKYDAEIPVSFETDPNSEGLAEVHAYLEENFAKPAEGHKGGEPIASKRKRFDEAGRARDYDATFTPVSIPTDYGEMSGEWVTTENCNPDKRILYIHGGAFTVGSCYSHRPLTVNLARLTGASVLAINYRLMPEHKRMAGIEDCRTAYDWILDNGPDGPFQADRLVISGDSAGGNLTLSLLQWARDTGRRAADAAVCFSPLIDGTFSGKSIRTNLETDRMLKPLIGDMFKMPRPLLMAGTWAQTGIRPSDPVVSPIFGRLHDLPPTLIQASSCEILYDDAVRYTVKARQEGADVKLQTWSHMPHVWQIFDTMLPEATAALEQVADFVKIQGL